MINFIITYTSTFAFFNETTVDLLNNDINSTSSKNKKAKELNVPIITEEDFMREYLSI